MAIKTIRCRLIATSQTRQTLWQLMEQHNSLVSLLLREIANHPDFPLWRKKGKLPAGLVKQLCDLLKKEEPYNGLPARLYSSAISEVEEIYASWLAIQHEKEYKLQRQRRWLTFLKSDVELSKESGQTIDQIKSKAAEILAQCGIQPAKTLFNTLINLHNNTEDSLTCAALCYLLKNRGKIPTDPENTKAFNKYQNKVQNKIKRLSKQLENSIPKGRELTRDKWYQTLEIAATRIPESEEIAHKWQDILITDPDLVPLPITFGTNEDLRWSKDVKGRLCVRFNGLTGLEFKIYCDNRQLHWFQRFYQDQETKRASKNQHSSALFTLRSAQIIWIPEEGKGNPWDINHLALHCSIDTRLATEEGTTEVIQEKSLKATTIVTKMREKQELSSTQQACVLRNESTLARLNNSYSRPSRPLYQGQSHILVAVAMRLEEPATVAVIDGTTGKVLTYRSTKQLLGDNYRLLNRQHQEKKRLSHERHKAQRNFTSNRGEESELGKYIDKLLTKAVIEIAKGYQAGSIVLPSLKDIRETIEIEIQTRAQEKIPNCQEAQKKYMKEYRMNIHQWSYNRLIENIAAAAHSNRIVIEQGQQPVKGCPTEQSKDLALSAYHLR